MTRAKRALLHGALLAVLACMPVTGFAYMHENGDKKMMPKEEPKVETAARFHVGVYYGRPYYYRPYYYYYPYRPYYYRYYYHRPYYRW